MKTRFLLPHGVKPIGWVVFITAIIIGFLSEFEVIDFMDSLKAPVFAIYNSDLFEKPSYFKIIENEILDELITILVIIGGILVGFSKVKTEDEFTMQLRSESLIWAFYVSSALNIIITVFVYGSAYFSFLVYNLFFQLIFFVLRFHYALYKSQKELSYEE